MGMTAQFATLLAGIRFDNLPAGTVTAAESALVDHLAVGLFGSRQPWSRIVAEHAVAGVGPASGPAALYGRSEHVPPAAAARVNGTASHSFELDDLYEPGSVHPGAVVIPAALAAAQAGGRDGREVIAAIVAGYEAVGRLTVATASHMGPFHTTGTHGVIGAAVAAAKLAGGDAEALANVLGIAASFSGGLKAFQSAGGEIKRLHPGRSAEGGVLAVELAERGMTGPLDVLENKRGFFTAYAGDHASAIDLDPPTEDSFVIGRTYVKPYPSCSATHSAISAVRAIRAGRPFDPDQVEAVTVGTSERGVDQNSIPNPTSTMAVQYSLESAVALALLGREQDPRLYVYDSYRESPAPELASRVKIVLDAQANAAYPARMASRVEITLAGGEVVQYYEPGLTADSSPAQTRALVEEKFHLLSDGLLSREAQDEVLAGVGSLHDGGPIDVLLEAVGPGSLAARNPDPGHTGPAQNGSGR